MWSFLGRQEEEKKEETLWFAILLPYDKVLKSRNITLPTKINIVKAMAFSSSHVWMWQPDHKEDWVSKNWCLELCWRRLLKVPWTTMRSNYSILREINPECSLEGLMLKLNLQYFDQLTHGKRPWCWKRLKAGREGDDRGCNGWMAHWLDRYEFEQALAFGDGQGSLRAAVHGVTKNQTWLSNWTELKTEINHSGNNMKKYIYI